MAGNTWSLAAIDAIARYTVARIHPAKGGYRCRCGACRHQIMTIAQRAGLHPHVLAWAIAPERERRVGGRTLRRDGFPGWAPAGTRRRPARATQRRCCGDPLCRG